MPQRSYRHSKRTDSLIVRLAGVLQISKTEVVARAIELLAKKELTKKETGHD